ncbi:hypothetical protein AGABI2DRAFT_141639 [Agaricus bisporus var. bisporus H97]|uniref:hypothetical protein n=1 Tax=Agaricus bisporus var. bisporus (strain H97 / ATCC MYA-4626 / FGSC 10389) TaxID=936046 RepID=UPI00029F5F92|nr:hypothetical protein AGABI2DRAFT_141639 [Agaricus bisporus var. bisporus H97]EKV48891.1 hypothetical protein AGABI2DRAFT_141639 [Agaricus bisporus var. bisporus H97]
MLKCAEFPDSAKQEEGSVALKYSRTCKEPATWDDAVVFAGSADHIIPVVQIPFNTHSLTVPDWYKIAVPGERESDLAFTNMRTISKPHCETTFNLLPPCLESAGAGKCCAIKQQAEQHAEHQFSHVDHVLMIATPLAGTLADLAVLICCHLKIVSKIFRRNVPLDGNLTPDAPEADSTEPNPLHKVNLFFGIIATQVQQAIDDEHDNSGSLAFSDKWVPIKIADLFQLESPYWESLYGRFAVLTLEDRLEFYELLDKDAEGELVDDEGLDLSIGAIVMDGFRLIPQDFYYVTQLFSKVSSCSATDQQLPAKSAADAARPTLVTITFLSSSTPNFQQNSGQLPKRRNQRCHSSELREGKMITTLSNDGITPIFNEEEFFGAKG